MLLHRGLGLSRTGTDFDSSVHSYMLREKLTRVAAYNRKNRYYFVKDNWRRYYRQLVYLGNNKWRRYEVILLVCLEIGAIPLINIMNDLNRNILINTRKAYFHWVTQEHNSFESLRDVLNEVVKNDNHDLIEAYNYFTSVYDEEGEACSAWITMLQSLYQARKGVDIMSGTRVMTYFASPN